jgi:ATP-dependent protease HslVU (ClpYQ) peptidase subunit
MSCVVGLLHEGDVYIGADGFATTEDGERRPIVANKIIRNKHYLIGYTGSVRTGQIVDPHYFEPPDDIQDLAEALREHLYAKGCVATAEGGISMQTCNFLVGYKDQLYEILMDFQLNKVMGNFTAVGSGASYAMGAMHVLNKTYRLMTPENKLEFALEAAAKFHTSCGPPFSYEKL